MCELKLEDASGKVEIIGGMAINVKKEGQGSGSFFVVLPAKTITDRKTEIHIGLYGNGKKIDEIKTNFLGPIAD